MKLKDLIQVLLQALLHGVQTHRDHLHAHVNPTCLKMRFHINSDVKKGKYSIKLNVCTHLIRKGPLLDEEIKIQHLASVGCFVPTEALHPLSDKATYCSYFTS